MLMSELNIVLASTFFHLPVGKQRGEEMESSERTKYITWATESQGQASSSFSSSLLSSALPPTSHFLSVQPQPDNSNIPVILKQVLDNDNLYDILGISDSTTLDRLTLRRAYLSRSRACHPEYVITSTVIEGYLNLCFTTAVNFQTTRMQHTPSKKLPLPMISSPSRPPSGFTIIVPPIPRIMHLLRAQVGMQKRHSVAS
jgi:hypothetical protein